jgi:long-chain fatty acid transport protein
MKSVMFLSLILVLSMGILMAGGIVTNTNQSAAYMRTLNRNASINLDAVYYNPAGLASLSDGLHLSLNNQSIMQTKTVTNDYQYLNGDEFVGKVSAPLFPDFYAAFKTGKLAVSAGFEPIGGGGSANFEKGLPSFEMSVADLKPGLASQGATGYDLDIAFEGSSIYYGFQGNVSYKISNLLSVGVGGRYVMAVNQYVGHLKSIGIIFPDAVAASFGGNPQHQLRVPRLACSH